MVAESLTTDADAKGQVRATLFPTTGLFELIVFKSQNLPEIAWNRRFVDLIIHPLLPAPLQALPHLNLMALTCTEESTDERNARQALGLGNASPGGPSEQVMEETTGEVTPHDRTVGQNNFPTMSSGPVAAPHVQMAPEKDMTSSSDQNSRVAPQLPLQQHRGLTESPPVQTPKPAPAASITEADTTPNEFGSSEREPLVSKMLSVPGPVPDAAATEEAMAVDDEEEDGNIEVPAINMESDSESE